MKNTKRALLVSFISLMLCFSMLIGTTYAWFTDEVSSGTNIIKAGNLDIGMYWSENNTDWKNAEGNNAEPIFNYDKWEPGYTVVRYVKVTNEGSLAFKYQMLLSPNGTVEKLAEVIDVYYDVVTANESFVAPTAENKLGSLVKMGSLSEILDANGELGNGVLLPADELSDEYLSGEIVICFSFHMQESAGNEYQGQSIGTSFGIKLYASQYDYESDSFGSSYDDGIVWPEAPSIGNSAYVEVEVGADGKVAEDATIEGDNVSAVIPSGVQLTPGTNKLTLNVELADANTANITLSDNEDIRALDVHIDGIAEDNTVPMAITIKEALPVGLNLGNYTLHHVENGETVAMAILENSQAPAHNTFSYDPATGDVVIHIASFSVIAFVANLDSTWEGNVDHTWYLGHENSDVYYVSNADQLWSFSQIVGGMAIHDGNKIGADTFEGKTVMLTTNINLGYAGVTEGDNPPSKIFYPIGYYNTDGTYEKSGYAITSGFKLFKGTFDGAGYSISNFYQNTWDMKGDHNWYDASLQYYRDGMGLFGRVYGGTIRNLTVTNFSSDGEITTTGTIAAYADHGALFENIAIINCNPRVYNIGNGGIVGVVGWYEKEVTDKKVTFRNITVDNTNKISALWGSWDVACGGIVGTYYPTSGQSSAGYPANAGISFENCHVGAQIDVYNDVCANYQYYAYRYAGMMIGSVAENETIDGRVYPKMDGIVASDCTVHFGTWNDYYYCELVSNTLASYTHDHQMSRLEQVASVDVVNMKIVTLKGEEMDIPTSGRVNYVVVKAKNANGEWIHGDGHDYADCYHFVNGVQHFHDAADNDNPDVYEIVNGEKVLKEDKQVIYREFNNLVTGDGWGATSKEIGQFDGVTILDRTEADSVNKFEVRTTNDKPPYPIAGREYKISHIFNLIETDVRVIPGALTVTVSNLDEDGNVTATFTRSATSWADSTIVFSGNGRVRVTIQDYYYCNVASADLVVRSYPEGSIILNFTYDGFVNHDAYDIPNTADEITTGKHGVYDYDFGFGPEVLDYALKIDSKGSIGFDAKSDGTIVIAIASNTVGATLDYKIAQTGSNIDNATATELVKIYEANKLVLIHLEVTAGNTYKFVKGDNETAIYYIGYLPDSAVNAPHDCAYYEKTTATCEKGGTTTRTCLVCGKGTSQTVGALGHNYIDTAAHEPTCTSAGKTAGSHCANCGDVKIATQTIAKLSHTYRDDICTGCGGFAKDLHTFENGVCTGCGTQKEDADNSKFSYEITHSIDFTLGNTNSYSEYRTYFLPRGICTIDSSGKYVIMKSLESSPSYIEFTAEYPTTLIVTAASTGAGNTTSYMLIDAEGNMIAEKTGRVNAVGANGTTFIYTITKAGTYRFVCTSTDRVGRLMSMKTADNHTYTETIIKAPTCTEDGEKTLSCGCGYSATITIPAAHTYVNGVCSVCYAKEGSKVHNFTTDGKVSDFFIFNGSLSTGKGTITYNGEKLSQCLKLESDTSITFTTTRTTTLTLIVGGTDSKDSWVVKIDDKNYTPSVVNGADYRIITIELAAGSHKITKGHITNVYYMTVE